MDWVDCTSLTNMIWQTNPIIDISALYNEVNNIFRITN